MSSSFNPEIILQNLSPEVKSFIYQNILDFEPFSTPDTLICVEAKNPLELLSQNEDTDESEGKNLILAFDLNQLPKKSQLKKMFRICISLTEEGQKIEAEALHENVYDAIRMAKDHLVETLSKIQDDVMSSQDRHYQVKQALGDGSEVH